MKKIVVLFVLLVAISCSSCQIAGRTAAIMGSPTRSERTVEAEFDLAGRRAGKILVLVNQPLWLEIEDNLRFHLTGAINTALAKKIRVSSRRLINYEQLSEFRAGGGSFSALSPGDVGTALGAETVLVVTVQKYKLTPTPEGSYYRGLLDVLAVLFDTASGDKLWPKDKGKVITVGFEIESGGRQVAISRLTDACAHCIVRYFYDCPQDKFKIADDKTDMGWIDWE